MLFSVGEALEGFAAERARGALEALLDLAPPVAFKLDSRGQRIEVPVGDLAPGDHIMVRPGDRVGADGIVSSGHSAVDQAAITGESIPADKAPGDAVYAGTINTFGALEIEVTRRAADNTLSQMVALVREAQSRQAPVQRFIDRFARVYTPAVALVAILLAALPPLLFAQPFLGDRGVADAGAADAGHHMSVCVGDQHAGHCRKCADARGGAGRTGQGGRTLALGRVDVVAFDKTGTLTTGHPTITDELKVCEEDSHEHNGLSLAASVEKHSSIHWLGLSLPKRPLRIWPPTSLPMSGLSAVVGSRGR